MRIEVVKDRRPELVEELVAVWESAVRATHDFLANDEVERIKAYVGPALAQVERLVVAFDENGRPVAFMGVADGRLEMLFVSAGLRGRGVGSALLARGMAEYGLRELTVNEQNPAAVAFYEHKGFVAYRRSDHDEEGGPYPLLYMRLQA